MAEGKIVNGVNADKLLGTIDAGKADPVIVEFKFRASNKWINDGHNRTTIKGFCGIGKDHDHLKPLELFQK